MISSLQKNYDNVIIGSEPEKDNSEPVNPEIEHSPEAIKIPSEIPTSEQQPTSEHQPSEQTLPVQPTSEKQTELIPDQISEHEHENTVVLND
ncbi:hypothetical protein A2U01_0069919, partial [Trifolium medium]|nr:hypothetical protein [Trifolium medium]